MMNLVDSLLDRLTMYRLLLYYLLVLLGYAAVLCLVGAAHYSASAIMVSAGVLLGTCWTVNLGFARFLRLPHNPESALITALILALIITPSQQPADLLFAVMAAVLAMVSKYLLTVGGKHVFNPAAIAVVLTAFGAHQTASWWIGSAVFMPLVVLGGWLLVRKLRDTTMAVTYLAATAITVLAFALTGGGSALASLKHLALSSPVWFFASVMLIEPLTSPATRGRRLAYAGLVGVLSAPQFHIGSLYLSPELALVIGNVFSFVVTPRVKLMPKLVQKQKLASNIADFVFEPGRAITYRPGQYLEWTLPHPRPDSRGSRRYFTLASSPTEQTLRIGVKFYDKGSSFKRALAAVSPQSRLVVAQLGGDFVMPKDPGRKLAFIAAGIGITPYRSMLKYLVDTHARRDVVLVYGERTESELVYMDVFGEAVRTAGLRMVRVLSDPAPGWTGRTGRITSEVIAAEVPDFHDRLFYISGPQPMVQATRRALIGMGVARRNIKTDLFTGYA